MAALVISLAMWLIVWIPFVNLLAPILWILAIVFGFVALSQVKNSQGMLAGRGLAIASLWISFAGVIIGTTIVLAAVVFVLVSDLGGGVDCDADPTDPACQEPAPAVAPVGAWAFASLGVAPARRVWADIPWRLPSRAA